MLVRCEAFCPASGVSHLFCLKSARTSKACSNLLTPESLLDIQLDQASLVITWRQRPKCSMFLTQSASPACLLGFCPFCFCSWIQDRSSVGPLPPSKRRATEASFESRRNIPKHSQPAFLPLLDSGLSPLRNQCPSLFCAITTRASSTDAGSRGQQPCSNK